MSGEDEVSRAEPDAGVPSGVNGPVERRGILGWLASIGLIGGLAAAYGTFGAYIARFLFPARPTDRSWLFVTDLAGMREGDSLVYKTPAGAPVNITRRSTDVDAGAFVALSSTCPHLGCQVHWESQNNRYFCPCHNGVFDPTGKATEGPPADAGQTLLEYPLRVADGMLFIQVPVERLADGRGQVVPAQGPPGPGHDPCLYPDTLTGAVGPCPERAKRVERVRAGRGTTGLAGVRRS